MDSEKPLYINGWSPDGQRLLIDSVSYQEGVRKVRTVLVDNPDGPGLVASSQRLINAGWSPDGAFVAFDVVDAGLPTATVWLTSADGANVWRLEGLRPTIRFVGWAPDGHALLVMEKPGPSMMGDATLWLITMPTCRHVQVGDGPVSYPRSHWQPAWSPSGSELVYVLQGDLYLLDRETLQSRRVTSGGDYSGVYAWSPDGRLVVTSGGRLVDLETGTVTAILGANPSAYPAVSPDGGLLAVMEAETEPQRDSLGTLLYDLEQGTLTLLTDPSEGYDAQRAWTPDGGHLVVRRSVCWGCDANTGKVLIVDIPTGEELEVTDGFEHAASYALSPDGSRLLVTGTRLRLVSLDGTVLREIVPPQGLEVAKALWSPDGTRFAYLLRPAGFSGL